MFTGDGGCRKPHPALKSLMRGWGAPYKILERNKKHREGMKGKKKNYERRRGRERRKQRGKEGTKRGKKKKEYQKLPGGRTGMKLKMCQNSGLTQHLPATSLLHPPVLGPKCAFQTGLWQQPQLLTLACFKCMHMYPRARTRSRSLSLARSHKHARTHIP